MSLRKGRCAFLAHESLPHPPADPKSDTIELKATACWRTPMRRSRSWLALLSFGAAVAGAAWFGSRFSPQNPATQDWYSHLAKPSYNPPNAVFPIVWPVLYTLMTVAGWRTWRQEPSFRRSLSLSLWTAQLLANAAWTYLFFGRHAPKHALADIVVMESLIVAFIVSTQDTDRPAALCFLPYAAWVAFATLLNAEIVLRNPAS
jgi:translocator protein